MDEATGRGRDGRLVLVGPIVRLQVQTEPLKRGERPGRWYDPAPITAVPALCIEPVGVRGGNTAATLDVHHRDHPRSRYRGENGVSVGFTARYELLRHRFGGHLTDGVAGENILVAVAAAGGPTAVELAGGLLIEAADGPLWLDEVVVATPCVEFSAFCVGLTPGERPDRRVTEALQFLDGGMRGFYATPRRSGALAEGAALIRPGDRVYRVLATSGSG